MHACNVYQFTFYYVMLLSLVGVLVCAATKSTNIFLYSSASHTPTGTAPVSTTTQSSAPFQS